MEAQIRRIKRDLDEINAFNATPNAGVTRITFSKEYAGATRYVVEELKKLGAKVSICRAGNVRGRLDGSERDEPAVMVGSHIDTVVHGGRFDGVAGVVAALEAARVIAENRIPHRSPIDVAVFPEEEGSRFGSLLMGSRAWAGKLSLEDLGRIKDSEGTSYLDAMEQAGAVPEDQSVLAPGQLKAMLELHIEQSVILDSRGLRLGIIEAIAGIRQFLVTVEGTANHAGGTPMGLRRDALQGAARMISAVEDIANHEATDRTVATVGFIRCEPGQSNIIPGRVQFSLDIRDVDPRALGAAVEKIMNAIEKTSTARGLAYRIEPRSDTPPVPLSQDVVALMERAAEARGVKALRMISGALHDSSVLAELTDVGMIFLPSKDGRSHCPEELTDLEHIKTGTDVLLDCLIALSS